MVDRLGEVLGELRSLRRRTSIAGAVVLIADVASIARLLVDVPPDATGRVGVSWLALVALAFAALLLWRGMARRRLVLVHEARALLATLRFGEAAVAGSKESAEDGARHREVEP